MIEWIKNKNYGIGCVKIPVGPRKAESQMAEGKKAENEGF
jgi:hypothetical protein